MVTLLIKFSEEQVPLPLASEIILENKVLIAILMAHIDSKGGEMLIEVPDEAEEKIVKAFRKRGVNVSIPKLIEVDSEKCFSCGSCVALCPIEAISIEKDASIKFHKEKCLGSTCSICVDACPARAIKSIKQVNNEHTSNHRKKEVEQPL